MARAEEEEEEEDAGLATKDLSQARGQNDSAGGAAAAAAASPQQARARRDAEAPQHAAAAGSPSASPQGNERRISVSSPGRGHKIFVVTRVESLPERAAATARPREDGDGPAAEPAEPLTPASESPLRDPRANGAAPASAAGVDAAPSPEERGNPAPCESQARDAALPNGLKTDFARALPDVSPEGDGKAGSCAAEHELSCSKNEKELEELLLEASQDTGQEPL